MISLRASIRTVPVFLVTIVSFYLISGCAGPVPKKIDITPALLSNIGSVAIVESPEIKTYAVINLGHPGRALGLFGGLFAQADKQETDYLPTILAMVTLSDKSHKIIYRGFHATGYQPNEDGWKHTPAKITFTNFAALMASPESTARSLNEAAPAIAATISTDLRR